MMLAVVGLMAGAAIVAGARIEAQTPAAKLTRAQLRDEVAARGDAMFRTVMGAYGQCDLEKFASYFVEDVEFYHDNDGLITPRASLLNASKNVCGTHRREVVTGTREVYPVPGYGAIEAGSHRFYRRKEGSTEEIGGTVAAKYLHVWQQKDATGRLLASSATRTKGGKV